MEVINEVARQQGQHQYLYDFETLSLRMAEAGFSSIRRCKFREGVGPRELLIDRDPRV